jgi:glycine hydroxymethyltransferase
MMGRNMDNPWGRTLKNGTVIKMSQILNSGVFPGMQGGPLEHVIAAKAIAFGEALQPTFKDYGKQVIANSQAMANAFLAKGYKIISGGTDNHLMLLDLSEKGLSGKLADEVLGKASITVNKNMVPFDKLSPMVTSGIRIGTAAITSRGFKENDAIQVVEWIDSLLSQPENDKVITMVKENVHTYMKQFPLYPSL